MTPNIYSIYPVSPHTYKIHINIPKSIFSRNEEINVQRIHTNLYTCVYLTTYSTVLTVLALYTFSKCVGKCSAVASVHHHHSITRKSASTAFVARLRISTGSQNTKRKAFYLYIGIVSLLTIHKLRSIHPASMSPLKVRSCTCKARRCAGAHCCCFWPPCCHVSLFIFEFSSRTSALFIPQNSIILSHFVLSHMTADYYSEHSSSVSGRRSSPPRSWRRDCPAMAESPCRKVGILACRHCCQVLY